MSAPKWVLALLRRLAPPGRAEEVVGDVEEAHRKRVQRRGRVLATFLTGLEALDMAVTLMRRRFRLRRLRRPPSDANPRRRRGINWVSPLDFKLGFRMLVKYPAMTVVGTLAISFAMAVGVGTFEFMSELAFPTIPLDEGHRIVEIHNWDRTAGRVDRRAMHDFVTWRAELASVEDLVAYRGLERSLIAEDGRPTPVAGVEITASAFRLARVAPLLGRSLVEADEQIGAPPVVVVGFDLWRTRFAGDPDVLGRPVRLGTTSATVVGVMPEGFGFPFAQNLWAPFRVSPVDYERGGGPAIGVLGRLAPGYTIDDARTELTTIGSRAAADYADTHGSLQPRVEPFGREWGPDGWVSAVAYSAHGMLFLALMGLACANVALLVFVRTASREREIVLRNALGASRGRIVMQLFAEALVLGAVAAVVGLAAASVGLRWAIGVVEQVWGGPLPFWVNGRLAPTTVLYALSFAVFGAIVVGVLPALNATGRHGQHARLQRLAGGGSRMRVGGLWTGVVVTQVALTVAFLPIMIRVGLMTAEVRDADLRYPAEEYLSVLLTMDTDTPVAGPADPTWQAFVQRYEASFWELKRRLVAEPGVSAVAFVDRLPGDPSSLNRVEVEGVAVQPRFERFGPGHRVRSTAVGRDFFDALATPIVSGRGFAAADLESDQGVVIVNESFVRETLQNRNPIGRRLRYLNSEDPWATPGPGTEPGPWYEIVGVVRRPTMSISPDWPNDAGLYHLLAPENYPVRMMVHVAGDPEGFAPRLRTLAAAVNPALQLRQVRTADEAGAAIVLSYQSWFRVVVVVGLLGLLLTNAGIYSVMAFTVSQRTREIGVRVALGADGRSIVMAILSRAFGQVGLGVIVGVGLLISLMAFATDAGVDLSPGDAGLLLAYMVMMVGVCLTACIVPTRRALRIQPTEALREE